MVDGKSIRTISHLFNFSTQTISRLHSSLMWYKILLIEDLVLIPNGLKSQTQGIFCSFGIRRLICGFESQLQFCWCCCLFFFLSFFLFIRLTKVISAFTPLLLLTSALMQIHLLSWFELIYELDIWHLVHALFWWLCCTFFYLRQMLKLLFSEAGSILQQQVLHSNCISSERSPLCLQRT